MCRIGLDWFAGASTQQELLAMDMDMAEVFDFRFPSQCSTPLFVVVCFCCLFLLLSKPAGLFASVCSVYGSYATAFLLVPLSSRLSLIRVCRQEPSLAILFFLFGGKLFMSLNFVLRAKERYPEVF